MAKLPVMLLQHKQHLKRETFHRTLEDNNWDHID
jgi:hypothetical protein